MERRRGGRNLLHAGAVEGPGRHFHMDAELAMDSAAGEGAGGNQAIVLHAVPECVRAEGADGGRMARGTGGSGGASGEQGRAVPAGVRGAPVELASAALADGAASGTESVVGRGRGGVAQGDGGGAGGDRGRTRRSGGVARAGALRGGASRDLCRGADGGGERARAVCGVERSSGGGPGI